jgi:hypothetical protein
MPQSKAESARYDAELLSESNARELWRLRCHWGDADENHDPGPFIVSVTFPHGWTALRVGTDRLLRATSADELRSLMIEDYGRNPPGSTAAGGQAAGAEPA